MPDFVLHCFGESGNSYKAALMLELCGVDWEPKFVPYFAGATQTGEWRASLNEMGEAPVLEHDGQTLSQSGVILDYLAEVTGKFGPASAQERREILRWTLFDNHKFTSYYATLRFLYGLKNTGETELTTWLRGRARAAYAVVDKHLAEDKWLVGGRPTIADFSLAGYAYYTEPSGMDRAAEFPHWDAWTRRLADLPGWKGPWDLMPVK
ncbi:glutathione S-transferase family protein [Oryzibacter oryziterrae]|uniref:glutathione S-transferase family protein n=1 Tax=Oryzibacter oryziterrae TaxID=2766474 RepID=UPI001F24F255|nr:glutathione S-transferase [Oryzibacter oryziterrae]